MILQPRYLFLLFVALIGLIFPAPVAAAEEDLVINVSSEYGGFYRPGRWYPVIVSIANKPKQGKVGDRSNDFNGTLIITASSEEETKNNYDFVREVSVPAYSVQRFTLLVKFPDDPAYAPELQVRTEGGRLVRRILLPGVQPLGKDQVLLVQVQEQTKEVNLPFPPRINPVAKAEVQPSNLPRQWAAYDSVNILVFSEWPEAQLSEQETQAILDWVGMGGTVVFLGGANSSSYIGAEDNPLMPVTTNSSTQYMLNESLDRIMPAPEGSDMSKNQGFLVSNIESVDSDAEVIWNPGVDEDTPVLVRKPYGRGQILFLGLDLEANNPRLRSALMPYWLAVVPLPNIADWEYAYSTHRKDTKIVTKGAARAPNIILIILICVLYTVAVGPVNFYLLGRYNRVQYAWFTVPVIVFLFSGLIYTFGTLTKGGKSIGREISVFLGKQDQPVVEERSLVSIFTPRADSFFIQPVVESHTVADSDRWHQHEDFFGIYSFAAITDTAGTGFGFRSANPTIRSTDRNVYIDSWPLRTFDATQFEVRGPRRLEGAIEANLRYRNQNISELWLEGKIRNETGMDFYESALMWGGRGLPLGSFENGDEKELTRMNSNRPFVVRSNDTVPGNWKHFDGALSHITPTKGRDSDSDINRENANTILRALFRPRITGDILPPLDGKLYFVGLAEDDELSVTSNFERTSGGRSIVVLFELNPVPESANFVVPQNLVQVRLQNYSGEQGTFTIESKQTSELESVIKMQSGNALVSAELPFQSPRVNPTLIDSQIFQTNADSTQVFMAGVVRFNANQATQFQPGAAVSDAPDNSLMTPYSGRAWIQMEAREDPEKKNLINIGRGFQVELDDVLFRVAGEMELD